MGEVKKIFLDKFGLNRKVFVADLFFDALSQYAKRTNNFTPIPRYQPITLDLTLIKPDKLTIAGIVKNSQKSSSLLREIEVRDLFRDEKVDKVSTSVTLRLSFWSTKPMFLEEAKKELSKITSSLERVGAKIKT